MVQEKLVLDYVGQEPVLLVLGPDGESVRVFRDHIPRTSGHPAFYRTSMPSSLIRMMPGGSNRPRPPPC